MTDDKKYCGIIDHLGLASLLPKTHDNAAHMYKTATDISGACYFEVPLTQSQIDIFSDIDSSEGFTAAKALYQFGGSGIEVPNDQTEHWDSLIGVLNLDKKKKDKN